MTRLTVSTVVKSDVFYMDCYSVFLVLSLDIFYFTVLLVLREYLCEKCAFGWSLFLYESTKLELTSQRESKISVSNKSSQLWKSGDYRQNMEAASKPNKFYQQLDKKNRDTENWEKAQ